MFCRNAFGLIRTANDGVSWFVLFVCLSAFSADAGAGVLFKRDNADPNQLAGFSGPSGVMAAVEFDSSTDPDFAPASQITVQAVRFYVNNTAPGDTFKVRVLRQAGESDADLTRPTSAFTDPSRALAEKSVVAQPAPDAGSFPSFTDWVVFDGGGAVVSDNKFFIAVELEQSTSLGNLAFDSGSALTKSWFFDGAQWHNFNETRIPTVNNLFSAAFPGGVIIQAIAGTKGDLDGNGAVNLGDAGRVIDIVLGDPVDEYGRFEADFDDDGSAPNLGDAIRIIDAILRR